MPHWLVEELSPRNDGPKLVPTPNGRRSQKRPEPSTDAQHNAEPVEPELTELADLKQLLGEVDPWLARPTVGWRSKELHDGRVILVGRCPHDHESGTSRETDLSAGFNPDGLPISTACTRAAQPPQRLTSD